MVHSVLCMDQRMGANACPKQTDTRRGREREHEKRLCEERHSLRDVDVSDSLLSALHHVLQPSAQCSLTPDFGFIRGGLEPDGGDPLHREEALDMGERERRNDFSPSIVWNAHNVHCDGAQLTPDFTTRRALSCLPSSCCTYAKDANLGPIGRSTGKLMVRSTQYN